MPFDFFHVVMAILLLAGIDSESLGFVSLILAFMYIKQHLEIGKIKSLLINSEIKTPKNKIVNSSPSDNPLNGVNQSRDDQSVVEENIKIHTKEKIKFNNEKTKVSKNNPDWVVKIKNVVNKALDFVNGVDVFTKLGSLIFLIGVGFLIKYASTSFEVTPVFKIAGTILMGVAIFALGFKLFKNNNKYGSSLEGLGLGIIYISMYAGLELYQLYAVNVALVSMIVISGVMFFMSIKQNEEVLSGIAILGSLIAPVLLSTGSGNIFLLICYYLIINVTLLVIVSYKKWSLIVIEGFLLTFSILSYWFLINYQPDGYVNCLVPLASILVIYIYLPLKIIQEYPLREKYLSIVICGVPAVIGTLYYSLLPDVAYVKALAAILFGLVYLLLFRGLVLNIKDRAPNTSMAYEVVGVVLLSFSLLFATDMMVASIAWAFEATLGLWLASKQQVKWRVYFCLSVLAFAVISWLHSTPSVYGDYLFLNLKYLGSFIMASSLMYSAYLLKDFEYKHISTLMLIMGSFWFFAETQSQLIFFFDVGSISTITSSLIMSGMMFLSCYLQKKLNWTNVIVVFEYMLLLALFFTITGSIVIMQNKDFDFEILTPFLIASALYGFVTINKETFLILKKGSIDYVITLFSLLYLTMVLDGYIFDTDKFSDYIVSLSLATILLIFTSISNNKFSIEKFFMGSLELIKRIMLSGLMLLTIFLSFLNPNVKFDYFPILSFIDVTQITSMFLICKFWIDNKKLGIANFDKIEILFAAFLSFSVTFLLLRIMHYTLDVPYNLDDLMENNMIQVSLTLLWVSIGLLVVYFSTIKDQSQGKKIGMVILGLVTIKLFVVDVDEGLSRVIAFVAVGSLYLGFGYWMQKKQKKEQVNKKVSVFEAEKE